MTWDLGGVERDGQSVTSDWVFVNQDLIAGVQVHEVKAVPKEGGYLTEVFRQSWFEENEYVDQVFQTVLWPGAVSAWHAHAETRDRLFCALGMVKVVLYDATPGSPTRGTVNVFRIGTVRPSLIIVPPGIWHGVQAMGSEPSLLLNIDDHSYAYEDPDHWRLPADSPQIPYSFYGEADALD